MFTGIIQGKGRLIEKRPCGGGLVFGVEADFNLSDPEEGESIACNGVCLTAKKIMGRRFEVDVSPESLSRTTLGDLGLGMEMNLERALRLSDRLGGHLVSGHVDATTPLIARRPEGNFIRFVFAVPVGQGRYMIEKGSITINGISLTINHCDDHTFSVAVIPHTLQVTTLGRLNEGDLVNIEVDLIGKYVEKLLQPHDGNRTAPLKISSAFLAEHGFLK